MKNMLHALKLGKQGEKARSSLNHKEGGEAEYCGKLLF